MEYAQAHEQNQSGGFAAADAAESSWSVMTPCSVDSVYSINGLQSDARLVLVKRRASRFDDRDFMRLGITMTPELTRSVDRRKDDYLCGRYCGRLAMTLLGQEPTEIHRAASGRPIWPSGVSGSISHSSDYACSLVRSAGAEARIGVDVEKCVTPIEADAVQRFALSEADERVVSVASGRIGRVTLLTLLFSAKESVFKALDCDEQRATSLRRMSAVAFSSDSGSSGTITLQTGVGGDEVVDVAYLLLDQGAVMTWCDRDANTSAAQPSVVRMTALSTSNACTAT